MYECSNDTLYMCEEHGSNQPINPSIDQSIADRGNTHVASDGNCPSPRAT